MLRNPYTTSAGLISLGILAGLVAYLAHTGNLNSEAVTVVCALAASGSANAIGNILSQDGGKR